MINRKCLKIPIPGKLWVLYVLVQEVVYALPVNSNNYSMISLVRFQCQLFLGFHFFCLHLLHFSSKYCSRFCCWIDAVCLVVTQWNKICHLCLIMTQLYGPSLHNLNTVLIMQCLHVVYHELQNNWRNMNALISPKLIVFCTGNPIEN